MQHNPRLHRAGQSVDLGRQELITLLEVFLFPQIKALVSSGGRFRHPTVGRGSGGAGAAAAAPPGSWLYEGGETRLVSLLLYWSSC